MRARLFPASCAGGGDGFNASAPVALHSALAIVLPLPICVPIVRNVVAACLAAKEHL